MNQIPNPVHNRLNVVFMVCFLFVSILKVVTRFDDKWVEEFKRINLVHIGEGLPAGSTYRKVAFKVEIDLHVETVDELLGFVLID